MKTLKKKLPEQPFYLSKSEEVNFKWCDKFSSNIEVLGARYGVPTDLVDKVLANNAVLKSVSIYESLLGDWLGQWRDTKNSLMYQASSPSPILLPSVPDKFPVLPTPVPAYVFQPFIQAANIILANPALSEADRNILGLVKADGKPVPPEQKKREKASEYNYPVMKVVVQNGVVMLRVVRGNNFKGKAIFVQVDREGKGVFGPLINTTASEFTDPISLPTGVLTAAWTYRAIYIEGQRMLSDWSPNQYVNVASEPQPIEAVLSPDLKAMVEAVPVVEPVVVSEG